MSRLDTDLARSVVLRKATGVADAALLLDALGLDVFTTPTAVGAAPQAASPRRPIVSFASVKARKLA